MEFAVSIQARRGVVVLLLCCWSRLPRNNRVPWLALTVVP